MDHKISKPKRLANVALNANVDRRPASPAPRRYRPTLRPSFIRLARSAAS